MVSKLFTYNKPKVIQALRYHFITRKEIKVMMILVNVFAIASAILFALRKISPFAFLISSIMWFVLMIIFWFLLPNIVYKKAATFKDSFTVTLNDTAFSLQNDKGGRSWLWRDFSTFLESPHFFHLYFNSRSFFIIPKDAFIEGEISEAREIFNTKISR